MIVPGYRKEIRFMRHEGCYLYFASDIAKALGFSCSREAFEACGNGVSRHIACAALDADERVHVVVNQKGKDLLLRWGEARGRLPKRLDFKLVMGVFN